LDPSVLAIEKRLSALESLLRKGPANATQVTAPFDVMSPDGKVILRVGSDAPTTGAVAIWSSQDKPGKVAIRSEKGRILAELGVQKDGYGVVIAADEEGVARAELNGAGKVTVFDEDRKLLAGLGAGEHLGEVIALGRVVVVNDDGAPRAALNNSGEVVVFDEDKNPVAKIEVTDSNRGRVQAFGELIAVDEKENKVASVEVTSQGRGEVTVWNKKGKKDGMKAASMESKDDNSGALTIMNSMGKVVVKVSVDQDSNAGKLNVMNSQGKPVVGLTGGEKEGGLVAVANPASVPLAQMSVAGDGRGLVQVFKKTGVSPVAVLTETVEAVGGLLQIFNSSGAVSSILGGRWQLTNASGLPTVEAGTLPDGRGTVRAGPGFKCVSARTPLFAAGSGDCLVGFTGKQ